MLNMDQKDKVFFDLVFEDKAFRGDHEIVEKAVNINGLALRYASSDLKNDRAIVLAAVRKNGGALWFASERLKGDPEIVLAAVNQNGYAIIYASRDLKNDRAIVLAAVKQDDRALECVSEGLKGDPEVVLEVMNHYLDEFTLGRLMINNRELRFNRDFMLAAVKKNWAQALKNASEALKADRDVVMVAVKRDGSAFEYASKALRKDPEVVLEAMKENLAASKYSLLSHEETKALLHRISLEFYIPFVKCQLTIFDKQRKNGSYIKQNEQTITKIVSYFSLTDASRFSQVSKETNELLEPDLKEAKSLFNQ